MVVALQKSRSRSAAFTGPQASAPRKLLICEEALKGHTGHWYEYNRAVCEMNRADGHHVSLLAHRDVQSSLVDELGAEPFFEHTNWDQIYNYPQAWRRYLGVLRHNRRVYREIDKYLRQSDGFDCVFAPTVVIHHLIGWLFLARKHGGRKAKRIVLFIRNSATTYENGSSEPVFKRSMQLLAWVLRQYQPLIDRGVVQLATDSHRLAEEYKRLAGVELVVFPHPCGTWPLDRPRGPSRRSDRIVMASLGPARLEKGIEVLVRAIELLARRPAVPRLHFVIQWNQPVVSPDGNLLELDEDLLHGTPVSCDLIARSLDGHEYNSLLLDSDVLLLPYLRQAYFARISGVAVEAMLAGIPMIYTDDTWVADIAHQYGTGLGFENEDAVQLANAICDVAAGIEQFDVDARRRMSAAKSHFSAQNFQRSLWENESRCNVER